MVLSQSIIIARRPPNQQNFTGRDYAFLLSFVCSTFTLSTNTMQSKQAGIMFGLRAEEPRSITSDRGTLPFWSRWLTDDIRPLHSAKGGYSRDNSRYKPRILALKAWYSQADLGRFEHLAFRDAQLGEVGDAWRLDFVADIGDGLGSGGITENEADFDAS